MTTYPYHETVLSLIASATLAFPDNFTVAFANFLIATTIPGGHHQEVIEAWRQRLADFDLDDSQFGVIPAIEDQDQRAKKMKVVRKLRTLWRDTDIKHRSFLVIEKGHIVFLYNALDMTEKEILKIPGASEELLDEMRVILSGFGLYFGMDLEEYRRYISE